MRHAAKSQAHFPIASEPEDETVKEHGLEAFEASPLNPASEIATCVADQHPTLIGRVRCSLSRERGAIEVWVPCVQSVRPRAGDRVLLVRPGGSAEPLAVGIVDGFRRRAELEPRASHARRLRVDEVVRIEGDDGQPLLEVRAGEGGAVVRLLSKDIAMEAAGALRIEAESVAIVARQGGVELRASDDVKLAGEHIHLN